LVHNAVRRKVNIVLLNAKAWMFFAVMMLTPCMSQPLTGQAQQDIAGTWQGTLNVGNPARIVVKITRSDSGGWTGTLFSIDESPYGTGVQSIALQGPAIRFSVDSFNATYEGRLSTDGSSIEGVLTLRGKSPPLNLVRATADTAWALPEPPRSMPAAAKPVFDVVTIKPSSPDSQGKMIAGVNGRHMLMVNTSVNDIVAFAYGLDPKQIIGAPAWSDSSPYDVDGVTDVEGQPNTRQLRTLYQALLADRFKLIFHREKRTLSVFAITVAKGGPKLTKSASAATDPTPFYSGDGTLKVTNNSLADIADVMKYFVERPVVDQTGLTGRYDFRLKWSPDEAQSSDPNAPPGIFTAIQEQLGLKLVATKAPVDVIVIDHVERPSAN
jgi:uncharacterized protein (TIGR03435 family)